MPAKIIAIVGPKGGIGKSTISSNLAISLSDLQRRVIAVDLDLGGANLHILLGVKNYKHTLDDFILKKVDNLSEILIDTDIKNLKLICGGANIPDIANMPFQQKMKIINHLLKLDCDTIILDLSAGSSFNVIDFLLIANQQILITSPESPSLIKVYGFIKSTVFRMLNFHFKNIDAQDGLEILSLAKDTDTNPNLKTINGIFSELIKTNEEAVKTAREIISKFKPHIVINMVYKNEETRAGNVISTMLKQYLNVSSSVITAIPADEMVRRALFKNKPMMLLYPGSPFSLAVKKLAELCI
ncbi:MAG TPA: AAA family ATPase [Nitrospirae bacterium]|nr:AAA family ATPase [Nitrospirota bacterium]